MNKDILQGDWNLIKGKIKEKWGKLTDDDLTQINGKREQLVGFLQKKYGVTRERIEEELSAWEKSSCGCECSSKKSYNEDRKNDTTSSGAGRHH